MYERSSLFDGLFGVEGEGMGRMGGKMMMRKRRRK